MDLRAKLLELTDSGQSTLASIATAQRAWANRVGAELSLGVLRRTSSSLARILELLADDAAVEG